MTDLPPTPRGYRLLIDGSLTDALSGETEIVHTPSGEPLAEIALGATGDLRHAIESAQDGFAHWAGLDAPERGDALWGLSEMLEGRRDDLIEAVRQTGGPRGGITPVVARKEVDTALARLACFAGWTDKFGPLLGGQDPVAGSHDAFSTPVAAGVVGVIAPETPSLLGAVSLITPPLCAGNAVVVVAETRCAVPLLMLAEACATSDVPDGALNIIAGSRPELIAELATARSIDALNAANLPAAELHALRCGAADNLARVRHEKISREQWFDADRRESPWTIEPFVEMKTVWHPALT